MARGRPKNPNGRKIRIPKSNRKVKRVVYKREGDHNEFYRDIGNV